mmetsp:Transcript_34295/g.50422  ORF Transcript_34295/g.50422 Transcript_34295/m.50422 type:complete len:437 (-) Transcript_34295:294-1604(-)|eukprot:CAMPEP_0195510132 /NCGR_PEP_ID=MMETSP0794_2-20130614/2872_1 /TAXON_ID=515487 /ORGANISM="Stephanopyxis turris, Strain CCMP 815" /LENGTH=436 /DNA_ID=CAMNT_0040637499 /DNA_START=267 /DNA_END=1577 /DNA_ORIENTATION=-
MLRTVSLRSRAALGQTPSTLMPSFAVKALPIRASMSRPRRGTARLLTLNRHKKKPSSSSLISSIRRYKSSQAVESSTKGASSKSNTSSFNTRQTLEAINEIFNAPRVIPFPRYITPKQYTITISEIFGHSAFFLTFVSFAVDDFLTLRAVAIVASSSLILFSYFHPYGRPLWLPLKWNCLFIAVNGYRIGKVYYDEYMAHNLSEELLHIHSDHFHVIDIVDFAKLVKIGEIETFHEGDEVLNQGKSNRYLRLVLDGKLDVFRDGQRTYSLEEGNFISEVGLHAGIELTGPVESSATVLVEKQDPGKGDGKQAHVRCIRWDRTELIRLLEKEKNLKRSFQAVLSWDVVSKLKAQRLSLSAASQSLDIVDKGNSQSDSRYRGILRNVLSNPDKFDDYKEEINVYRLIHHVSDESHLKALKEFGWTLEEFERGHQQQRK